MAAGLLLGAGFGVSLASLAAARTTASAYERILVAADAPDAAVAHGRPLEEAVRSLDTVEGIIGQRAYAGFRGVADGVDPALTTGLLASVDDRFPLELPELRARPLARWRCAGRGLRQRHGRRRNRSRTSATT